ncbi:hypothetical protein JXA12_00775 [Candidatus Woesearchaeota archaeon]|nr:hypothetical protein [Candidatus Woesearchaeota archaeon]
MYLALQGYHLRHHGAHDWTVGALVLYVVFEVFSREGDVFFPGNPAIIILGCCAFWAFMIWVSFSIKVTIEKDEPRNGIIVKKKVPLY